MVRIDDVWCQGALSVIDGIDANILVARLNKRYSYDECKQFDLIASCTTGTDHIDNRDIPIISLQGERGFLNSVWATAEHTFGLMLSLVRKIPFAHNDTCRGNWDREAWQGMGLRGKTLGIVGYGRVGQQVKSLAEAFGMDVFICDKPGGVMDSHGLKKVLSVPDIITVHVPLNDETRGMFGREQFAMMKPTAYFVNTSRGAVVDEKALIDALFGDCGKIAGAAIDVVAGEPDIYEPLREYAAHQNNLIITPHVAGNTAESREKTQIFIVNKIKEFIQGGG